MLSPHDFIKKLRKTKTIEKERVIIAKESALIRTALKDDRYLIYRPRNVIKLLYLNMLGQPTNFGQMEALKLITSTKFNDKRIGYLALSILLDEKSEILMLSTQSVKKDLYHSNAYIISLALTSIANVASTGIVRDLSNEIIRLMRHKENILAKKAILSALHLLRKLPEYSEEIITICPTYLNSEMPNIKINTLTLIINSINKKEELQCFIDHVPNLIAFFKLIILSNYKSYQVSRITNSFLQLKIISFLKKLLNYQLIKNTEEIYDIVIEIIKSFIHQTNTLNIIIYESIKLVLLTNSKEKYRKIAIATLSKFLTSANNNYRYIALNILRNVKTSDRKLISSNQKLIRDIMSCVNDKDISIKKRALVLIYVLINSSNIKYFVNELIVFIETKEKDKTMKASIGQNICGVIKKSAEDEKWCFDSILRVIQVCDIKSEVENDIINFIDSSVPSLKTHATRCLILTLYDNYNIESLCKIGIWCIGEYVNKKFIANRNNNENKYYSDTKKDIINMKDIIQLLNVISIQENTSERTHCYILFALIKLYNNFQNYNKLIEDIISSYINNESVELSQRASEFYNLINHKDSNLKERILSNSIISNDFNNDRSKFSVIENNDVVIDYDTERVDKEKNDDMLSDNKKYVVNLVISNKTSDKISNVSLSVAVPKYLKMEINNPSGVDLEPNRKKSIMQKIKVEKVVTNDKKVKMKIKLGYMMNGEDKVLQAMIKCMDVID